MHVRVESHKQTKYVASCSPDVFIRTPQDIVDLLAFGNEHQAHLFILNGTNLDPAFYDLKTGLAGEILQKFSNYHARVAIMGSFHTVASKRFQEFMYESNKGDQLRFTDNIESALSWLIR